jgi:hypothetical protein
MRMSDPNHPLDLTDADNFYLAEENRKLRKRLDARADLLPIEYLTAEVERWKEEAFDRHNAMMEAMTRAEKAEALLREVYENDTLQLADDEGPEGEGWQSSYLKGLWARIEGVLNA